MDLAIHCRCKHFQCTLFKVLNNSIMLLNLKILTNRSLEILFYLMQHQEHTLFIRIPSFNNYNQNQFRIIAMNLNPW